jgi:murein DD-endopeptidase MepM/ murein hydrolase activator NlpD
MSPFGTPNVDNANSVFYYNKTLNWAPIQLYPPNQLKVSSAPQPNRGGDPHYGMDLAISIGAPIVAPEDGIYLTTSSGFGFSNLGGYGVIVLGKSGLYHIFGHNSARSNVFRDGDAVRAGDIVAYVGNEGRSSGPHLHWEIRKRIANGGADLFYSPIFFANSNPTPSNVYTNLPVPGY